MKFHSEPQRAPLVPISSVRANPSSPAVGAVASPLDSVFREACADPSLAGALVGFTVLDEQGREVYASPLAGTALCPASALKTATTGAALELLGPEFRFETTIAAAAPATDGMLPGDLVLVGCGDPTLASADLDALADAVIASGIKKVTGNLRIDTSIFPSNPVSEHWNWGDIGNAYGAGAYGFNLDHNRVTLSFDPAAGIGQPATLRPAGLALPSLRWSNQVVTGPAGSGDQVMAYSSPYGRSVSLRGSVPLGEPGFEVHAAIPDPPSLGLELLGTRLEKAGVQFQGRKFSVDAPHPVVLARHQSAPLPEIIDHLHRVSDNLEAQCLFLTLGLREHADPAEVVRRYWFAAGLRPVGWRLVDGNGLARANMIRPLDLARLNFTARHAPHGDRFKQSLTAYDNGTTRAKLGAMSGVRTETGFIQRPDGREFTFALMTNGLGQGANYQELRSKLLAAARGL